MLKNLQIIRIIIVTVFSMVLFGCPSPEPDDTGMGVPTLFGNVRLTSVADWEYSYDSQGRLLTVDDYVYIDYNKHILYLDIPWSFTMNSAGMLTSMKGSYEDEEEDEIYSANYTYTLSYNSDNTIDVYGFTATYFYKDAATGKIISKGSDECEMRHTWNNGNLISKVFIWHDEEGLSEIVRYNYTYGNEENKYRQNTSVGCIDCMEIFAMAGITGVGTKNLPNTFKYTSNEGTETISVEYLLNNDKTINAEILDDDEVIWYGYEAAGKGPQTSPKSSNISKIRHSAIAEKMLPRHLRNN